MTMSASGAAPSGQRSAIPAALGGLLGLVLKYFAYNFLTAAVLLVFSALAFAYINFFGPRVAFASYLAFLFPMDSRGTTTVSASDILRAYSFLSLSFMLLSMTGRAVRRGLRRGGLPAPQAEGGENSGPAGIQFPRVSFHAGARQILFGCFAITLCFLPAFFAIPFARMAEGSNRTALVAVFGFFYLLAIVATGVYTGIEVVADLILDWARVNFPCPAEQDLPV